jgi:hypothetical protein
MSKHKAKNPPDLQGTWLRNSAIVESRKRAVGNSSTNSGQAVGRQSLKMTPESFC